MKTEAVTFLHGRVRLGVEKYTTSEGDPMAVLIIQEKGIGVRGYATNRFHLLEEDTDTIEEAINAFNDVMTRHLREAAE
jgi:hypothetical protein